MRTLAFLYAALLLAIVIAADLGALGGVVQGVHAVPLGDKVCHLVLAAGLGYLAASLPGTPSISLGRVRAPLPTLLVALVALLEELSQRFIPGRTFDLVDLAADALGLALGTLLALRRRALLAPEH